MLDTFRIDQAFYELGQGLEALRRGDPGGGRSRSLGGMLASLRSLLAGQSESPKEILS